ncbi:MAG: tRNA pseudouridine(38-40) synthase TruA [Chloroflexi bacterium]|nr:tRNA pseudouridine(38-40) synthase TruA [Chloroflexota bacterium]
MTTVKLTIEYDGSDYAGFQSQQHEHTVQDCLEAALLAVSGTGIRVRAAGRTDSGVHAEGQVVAFEYGGALRVDELKRALNATLPRDVSVLTAVEAQPGFDPRREASARVYEYRIFNRPERSALQNRRSVWVPQSLDVNLMTQACRAFLGRHDFRNFAAGESEQVFRHVFECLCWRQGDLVFIRIRANAFAKRMVRRIAGTLVNIGLGRWGPQDATLLLSGAESSIVAPSLPPHGLYLISVEYGKRIDVYEQSAGYAAIVMAENAR